MRRAFTTGATAQSWHKALFVNDAAATATERARHIKTRGPSATLAGHAAAARARRTPRGSRAGRPVRQRRLARELVRDIAAERHGHAPSRALRVALWHADQLIHYTQPIHTAGGLLELAALLLDWRRADRQPADVGVVRSQRIFNLGRHAAGRQYDRHCAGKQRRHGGQDPSHVRLHARHYVRRDRSGDAAAYTAATTPNASAPRHAIGRT